MKDKSCCHSDSTDSSAHPHSHAAKARPFYLKPVFLTLIGIVLLLVLSHLWPPFSKFHPAFYAYFRMIALPGALGFLIGGVIDYYIPEEYISKFLARKKRRTILYAAGLGFLMSACNHGILALSMALHRKGASGPAVVSFLLASPWANLPMTFILVGFFGWKGVLVILLALAVAVITGWVFLHLQHRGWIETNRFSVTLEEGYSVRRDMARRIREYRFSGDQVLRDLKGVGRGVLMLTDMVLFWILIGMVLAGLSAALVPEHFFHRFLGPSLLGLFGTLIAASILEVCSEGTSPLAFEIYRQTGAFGNAFAFLMAGVITDYTEIGLLWKNLGPRTALWMMAVTIPQVMMMGWVLNHFFR